MDSRFSSDFEPSSLASGQTTEAATEAAYFAPAALVPLDSRSTSVGVQERIDVDLGPDFGDRSSAGAAPRTTARAQRFNQDKTLKVKAAGLTLTMHMPLTSHICNAAQPRRKMKHAPSYPSPQASEKLWESHVQIFLSRATAEVKGQNDSGCRCRNESVYVCGRGL